MIEIALYESPQKTPFLNHTIALALSFVFIAFFISVYSCSKEDTEPAAGLTALVEQLQSGNPGCTCEPYVDEYKWANKIVYVLKYKAISCNWYPSFYDANGQEFSLPTDYTFEKFFQESKLLKTAWSCK